MNFIKENIDWIKDVFTIIFSASATTIAIMTYRRARETFLQPVRSEVIKKQTDLLIKLLKTLNQDKRGIDFSLNYEGLITLNVIRYLDKYGFILKKVPNEKDLDASVESLISSEGNILEEFELIGTFESSGEKTEEDIKELKKKEYEEAKGGNIKINRIFLTNKHVDYVEKLRTYLEDPFLPLTIKNNLEKIVGDIQENLIKIMKQVLIKFLRDVFERDGKANFSIPGVYNTFNHDRIGHKEDYKKLRESVREYLKVDSMPL